ncbi:hypothetical protein O6H91_Y117200 [Diphasiastrum complanatum]|nr:hypothetical protein O6H91_Y117200 [Diphasiastrum complanatum]
MLQYFSDGRRLNAAGKLVPSKRNQLPDLLYPINSESVQLSGDDKVEAVWTVDNDLRASELAFDINLTLYTSVIRRIPLWTFSYNILRLDPTLDHKQHVNWNIVAPIRPSPQLCSE